MATIYNLKPGQLFEVPKDDRVTECKMCLQPAVPVSSKGDDIDLGPLYQYGHPIEVENGQRDIEVYSAHYFCLLFSPGLKTNGEDEEGIKGFLPKDILKEWRRASKLRCSYCDKSYASIGCVTKSCKANYHLFCGIQNGSLQQFCGSYNSFCQDHRPKQNHHDASSKARECGMCLESIKPLKFCSENQRRKHIWSPCCSKWFHLDCVQKMALSAGYFFKCPMCNNKDDFEAEMKAFGVYIPEQDASWEREGNIFDGIYERHGTCDADDCLCPDGRQFDEDYTIWEIILCRYCGSQGIHVKCGNLPMKEEVKWRCDFCSDIVKKLPPKSKHFLHKINHSTKKKSSKKSTLSKVLSRTSFIIEKNQLICSSGSNNKLSVQLCPKYEIPNPVKLFSDHSTEEMMILEPPPAATVVISTSSPLKRSPLKKLSNNSSMISNNFNNDLEEQKQKHANTNSSKKSAKIQDLKKQKSILCYFNAKTTS